MARGNIFYITTDKDADVSFGESSYYEKLDTIGADYVEDQTKERSEIPVRWLSDTMFRLGATVGYNSMPGFAFSFSFLKTEQMLQDYFRPKLEKLKADAAAFDLFQVIQSAPRLDWICNNEYTDAVELHDEENGDSGTFLTVDDFIRRIRPGTTYYVYESVILMH